MDPMRAIALRNELAIKPPRLTAAWLDQIRRFVARAKASIVLR